MEEEFYRAENEDTKKETATLPHDYPGGESL